MTIFCYVSYRKRSSQSKVLCYAQVFKVLQCDINAKPSEQTMWCLMMAGENDWYYVFCIVASAHWLVCGDSSYRCYIWHSFLW